MPSQEPVAQHLVVEGRECGRTISIPYLTASLPSCVQPPFFTVAHCHFALRRVVLRGNEYSRSDEQHHQKDQREQASDAHRRVASIVQPALNLRLMGLLDPAAVVRHRLDYPERRQLEPSDYADRVLFTISTTGQREGATLLDLTSDNAQRYCAGRHRIRVRPCLCCPSKILYIRTVVRSHGSGLSGRKLPRTGTCRAGTSAGGGPWWRKRKSACRQRAWASDSNCRSSWVRSPLPVWTAMEARSWDLCTILKMRSRSIRQRTPSASVRPPKPVPEICLSSRA